jgi:GTP-binding protein HflX
VGFIRELPHQLVAAFRATLDETVHADLLLHVVDVASEQREQQIAQVNQVLAEVAALQIPQLLVMNKIDLLSPSMRNPRIEYNDMGFPARVFISACDGTGLDLLRQVLAELAKKK